jgi:hypothetical protein
LRDAFDFESSARANHNSLAFLVLSVHADEAADCENQNKPHPSHLTIIPFADEAIAGNAVLDQTAEARPDRQRQLNS